MNKISIIICMFLFFLTSGCNEATINICNGHFHMQPGWSDKHEEQIYKAADRWNVLAGKTVIWIDPTTTEPGCMIRKASASEVEKENEGHNPLGSYLTEVGDIRIYLYDDQSLISGEFITTVTHEMGHALGMPHISATGDLMSEEYGQQEFTMKDVFVCQQIGVCKIVNMSTELYMRPEAP